jgi:hypothetical protein
VTSIDAGVIPGRCAPSATGATGNIALRGRFNLNKAFYLTAESDVGGFGIGSDIAVQAYAALGCQITRNIHAEVGYRYLYDDFRDESANDFLYQLALHGAQITVGLTF